MNTAFYTTFHKVGQTSELPVYRAIQFFASQYLEISQLCGNRIFRLNANDGDWLMEDLKDARKHTVLTDVEIKTDYEVYDARYILSGGVSCAR